MARGPGTTRGSGWSASRRAARLARNADASPT